MKTFWLFRSNIRDLEYYHKYNNLKEFTKNCHDYYLLFPLWLLDNNYFDEVVIWRLKHKKEKREDVVFNLPNKTRFIQRWVNNFDEVFKFNKPNISFFRGGFKEYSSVIKKDKSFFGISFYLGASNRMIPQYRDEYDYILLESKIDIDKYKNNDKCIPFYKTSNPYIFKDLNIKNKKYDICWPNNFSQINYKGQEFFIKKISENKFLKSLNIIHVGNQSKIGINLCKKYNVKNIEFAGLKDRMELNEILNNSKYGLVTSNLKDGCPRISTEILMSGTPLIIRNKTRLLNYYKKEGVIEFNDDNIFKIINRELFLNDYNKHSNKIKKSVSGNLSFDEICKKNINLWMLSLFGKTRDLTYLNIL